jgi:hypothetical protein
LLNVTQDLRVNPIYSFTSDVVDNMSRFEIIIDQVDCTVDAGEDITICPKDTVPLKANGNGSFRWSTGSRSAMITVAPTQTTTYTVTLTSGNGATATDDVIVYVDNIHVFAGVDKHICKGNSVSLNAIGSDGIYKWDTGNNGRSINVSPMVLKIYTVTVNDGFCSASDAIIVRVYDNPNISLGYDKSLCKNTSTNIGVYNSSDYIYKWNTLDRTASININPTSTTTYSVTVTNRNGCTASDDIVINVLDCKMSSEQNNNNNNLDFEIYPNPASDYIDIVSNIKLTNNLKIDLYNILGILVKSEKISSDFSYYRLNLRDNIPVGIYMLNINYNGKIFNKQIIKE